MKRVLLRSAALCVLAPSTTIGQPAIQFRVLKEEVRIDGQRENLEAIPRIRVSSRGDILFAQHGDKHVLIYDANGKRRSVLGASGAGPGEFRAIGVTGWKNDSTWVWDSTLRRLVTFSATGKLVATTPSLSFVDANGSRMVADVLAIEPSGDLMLYGMYRSGSASADRQRPLFLVRAGRDGTVKHVLWHLPYDASVISLAQGAKVAEISLPFSGAPRFSVSSDGTAIALLETFGQTEKAYYQVSVINMNGDTTVSRKYPYTRARIPSSARDSIVRAHAAYYPDDLQKRLVRDSLAGHLQFYAPVTGVLIGDDKSVWVQQYTRKNEGEEWLILSSALVELGRVRLPVGVELAAATLTKVWGIARNDDDVESVVRFQLLK